MPGPAMLIASTYHLHVCCKTTWEKCKFDIRQYSGKGSIWQNLSFIACFWSQILNFLLQEVISRWCFHIFLQAYSGTVLGCLLIRNGSSPASTGGRVVFSNEFRGSMFSSKKLNLQRDFWYHFIIHIFEGTWLLGCLSQIKTQILESTLESRLRALQNQVKSYCWRKATGGDGTELLVSSQRPLTVNNFCATITQGNWNSQHSLPP